MIAACFSDDYSYGAVAICAQISGPLTVTYVHLQRKFCSCNDRKNINIYFKR